MPTTPTDTLRFSPKAAFPWTDLAGALVASYDLAEQSRQIRAARALACGLVAIIAKDIVGHGHFGAWLKSASLADLKERTVRNYMSAANAWLRQSTLKPATITASPFLRWTFAAVDLADFAESCKVWQSVTAYIGERSLWEIYTDEGIARERDPHQKHTPSDRTAQLTFDDIKRGWSELTRQVTALGHVDESWADLPDDLAWEFLDATVPVVRNLATTKNLTKPQRQRLEAELVTITTALRAAK